MPNIPSRLIVIQARIPTGESCEGCDYLSEYFDAWECILHRHDSGECLDIPDPPVRLPACRERDGWTSYPPGSGVPELVEAAKRRQAAEAAVVVAHYGRDGRAANNAWGNLNDCDSALAESARKVAEVRK